MFPYPAWEVYLQLVTFCNVKYGVDWWIISHHGSGALARDGDTGCLKLICNSPNLKINVVHISELLGGLFIV